MLTEAVIIALILALIAGGSWRSLAYLPLMQVWSVISAAALEIALMLIIGRGYEPYASLLSERYLLIQIVVYGLIAFFLYANRGIPGIKLILIGILLNLAVIAANNGLMPVDPSLAMDLGYSDQVRALAEGQVAGHTLLIHGQTKLPLLADIFHIPPPYPLPKTISVGDMLLAGGAFWLIVRTMLLDEVPEEGETEEA